MIRTDSTSQGSSLRRGLGLAVSAIVLLAGVIAAVQNYFARRTTKA